MLRPTLALLLLAAACSGGPAATAPTTTVTAAAPTTTSTPATANDTRYGVVLSPLSYEGDDFASFLETVPSAGSVLSWGGQWSELGQTEGAPAVMMQLSPAVV